MDKQSSYSQIKKYACKDIQDLMNEMDVTLAGLSDEQVNEKREKYGDNSILIGHKDSVLYRLKNAFINPFSIILFIIIAITFILDGVLNLDYNHNGTNLFVLIGILLISGIIRFIQEMNSKQISDSLNKFMITQVSVRRNGKKKKILSEDLVVGDLVYIEAGDKVPADLRIIESDDLFVSQSTINGESEIIEKHAITIDENFQGSYLQFDNIVLMGSSIIGGEAQGIVLETGKNTVYGGISDASSDKPNNFKKGSYSIAKVLMRFMIILIPIVFIVSGINENDWATALLFSLSVSVGLVPELLPMVINACLAKATHAMEKKKTIVRDIEAMHELGCIDVLCVDKTGTLTGDTFLLEYYIDILGNESQRVLDYAFLNSFYHSGIENHLDQAILKYQQIPSMKTHFNELLQQHKELDELPFDYDRRIVSMLVAGEKAEDENYIIMKGDIDHVLIHCRYYEYNHKVMEIDEHGEANVHMVIDEMLEDGMKVMGVAYKRTTKKKLDNSDENEFILIGYLVFFDTLKKSAVSTIEKLNDLNVDVRVLTGDQKNITASICRRLNYDTSHIVTGLEFEKASEDERIFLVEQNKIFAELTPKEKAQIVDILQNNGHAVGYLGDGINDLPAIIEADVGISVENSMQTVKDSSDIILLEKDLDVLDDGIIEGRSAFCNMSNYMNITASTNFGTILGIVIASIFLPFFPMASIQLLLLDLLYDVVCLVLPWDNVDESRTVAPSQWDGRTLSRFMLVFGSISVIFDMITFAFLYFILCPALCGGSFTSLTANMQTYFIALFQTGWFLESMWTHIVVLYFLRTKYIPFVESRPSSTVVYISLLGIIIFTLLTYTSLGHAFGLTALPAYYYLFLIGIIVIYMLWITLSKYFYVKKYQELR